MHQLWAKLDPERGPDGEVLAWHSLVDHSADVASVVEALLDMTLLQSRLARLAGRAELDWTTRARLAALAFLHDIGKANRGFQARIDPGADRVGHIDELAWVFKGGRTAEPICHRLFEILGLGRMESWFSDPRGVLLETVYAHHGRPWATTPPDFSCHWKPRGSDDPIVRLASMRFALDRWFAPAFQDGPVLPPQPTFQHAFAGLLMLADWIGSDNATDAFPYANGSCADRMSFARQRAPDLVRRLGLDVSVNRAALGSRDLGFAEAFGFQPRPLQAVVAEPDAHLVVLEAETGSGKTEAALWRFKNLFERGLVDGVYFALPTRVAATQMFRRLTLFRDRIFPPSERPAVVLAVPGQARVDDAEGRLLPGFQVQWSDDPGEDPKDAARRRERWAAEHPKRFLAAPIAVGTIDQALLGAIRVKHAHLRGTALLRSLLVVDEVHASNRYMEALLDGLLKSHVAAGGHALLLSATLGSRMRSRLLGTRRLSLKEAEAMDYPALSWAEDGCERHRRIRSDDPREEAHPSKTVQLEIAPLIDDPAAIAERALSAARQGAKVLVLRNTVKAAVATMRCLEELAGAESALLFRVNEVATLHHARFSAEDRTLLDDAVQAAIGRDSPSRGLVVVGTQTLEQSLDLDADLLLTDLRPIDVLLQRIGRLHRRSRDRPVGFETPRTVVLTPRERDLAPYAAAPGRHGLGAYVYDDLRIVEATLRLIESEPVWTIPLMNRRLVEAATHEERLSAIEDELAAGADAWRRHFDTGAGTLAANLQAAHRARLDRTRSFEEFTVERDEIVATRLGARDRLIAFKEPPKGPFGIRIVSIRIASHLLGGVGEEDEPKGTVDNFGELSFRLGTAVFTYGRFGLVRNEQQ